MSGFVAEVKDRESSINEVSSVLNFPWSFQKNEIELFNACGQRLSNNIYATLPNPNYTKSIRDGYAVKSSDVCASTPSTPTYLKFKGSINMGEVLDVTLLNGEAFSIHTGGALPKGADSVVMLENTSLTRNWVEIRGPVQAGENIVQRGEEFNINDLILSKGELIDFRNAGILATLGIEKVSVQKIKISILSTGDEIFPISEKNIPNGCTRDGNAVSLKMLLERYGYKSEYKGILSDQKEEFEKRVTEEIDNADVLILSGGSSVGNRDNCSDYLNKLSNPGLVLRGLNMIPGKPTLLAGDIERRKLVISLPGHPLSCIIVAFTFLLPILNKMLGTDPTKTFLRKIRCELESDLSAKTGAEKFFPAKISEKMTAKPILAKSAYISALSYADGLISIPSSRETIRRGEEVEMLLW